MATEFARIARLARLFGDASAPAVGIGDDCAVLPGAADAVLTVDASVEGVHFRRDLLALDEASERAVEAALSDVAAMGAEVTSAGAGLLLAWTLPPGMSEADVDALATGAARAARRAGTRVVGGNLATAPVLTLTTTVLGRAGARVLLRRGARIGDEVGVTGAPGAAALGLRALLAGRGETTDAEIFVARWRAPRARLAQGRDATGWAHAAIDVSDGLAQDAAHLAEASRCGLVLDAAALPMLVGQREFAAALGLDAVDLALAGGEDYELIATGPRGSFPTGWTVVGEVVVGCGVRVVEGGRERAVPGGWDHFG